MVAVFGLKEDFLKYKAEHADRKEIIKLVTENIEKDFCGYNVEKVVFLENFWKGYGNLMKFYIKLAPYIRGGTSEQARQDLRKMIEIERTLIRVRNDMTRVAVMEMVT